MGFNISSNLQGQFTVIRKGEKINQNSMAFQKRDSKCFVFDRENNTQELMEYFNLETMLIVYYPYPGPYPGSITFINFSLLSLFLRVYCG